MNFRKNNPNKTILYGFHAVREAWLNPRRTIHNLHITDQALKGFEATLHEAKAKGIRRPPHALSDKRKVERMAPQGAVHQGLVLECAPLEEMDIRDLVIRTNAQEKQLYVILDQVTDPHNVGAIMRSACAFGAAGMILQRKHSPGFDGVLAKTASGALEHLPVALETNLSRAIEVLKEEGFFIYGLSEHADKPINQLKTGAADKAVLVLGAEGSGLRRLIIENCDELVKLPTRAPIESLNVSNAAAVALYEMMR